VRPGELRAAEWLGLESSGSALVLLRRRKQRGTAHRSPSGAGLQSETVEGSVAHRTDPGLRQIFKRSLCRAELPASAAIRARIGLNAPGVAGHRFLITTPDPTAVAARVVRAPSDRDALPDP
jgi:hypothetical protein